MSNSRYNLYKNLILVQEKNIHASGAKNEKAKTQSSQKTNRKSFVF